MTINVRKIRFATRTLGLIAVCAALIALGVGASAAKANASTAIRKRVTLSFAPNRIEQTSLLHVRYSAVGLPVGAELTLERQVGTAHVWRYVERLHGSSGSANAPRVAQGRYVYRILATSHGKPLVSSRWTVVFSYGAVSLSTLCGANNSPLQFSVFGCQSGTEQVGTSVFPYAAVLASAVYPQWWNDAMDFTAPTTCRSGRFSFAEESSLASYPTYLRLAQQTMDPQSATALPDNVGYLAVHFDGHPWALDAATGESDGLGAGMNVYLNATFDCWTATGF